MKPVKAALRPENEAPRKTWQGPRGTTNYISSNNTANSISYFRLQRLSALYGVMGLRAELISSLVWGEAA
jgi:hypothetical protein